MARHGVWRKRREEIVGGRLAPSWAVRVYGKGQRCIISIPHPSPTCAKIKFREPKERSWELESEKAETPLQQWQTIGLKNRTPVLLLDLPSAFHTALDQAKAQLAPIFKPTSPLIMTFAQYSLVTWGQRSQGLGSVIHLWIAFSLGPTDISNPSADQTKFILHAHPTLLPPAAFLLSVSGQPSS